MAQPKLMTELVETLNFATASIDVYLPYSFYMGRITPATEAALMHYDHWKHLHMYIVHLHIPVSPLYSVIVFICCKSPLGYTDALLCSMLPCIYVYKLQPPVHSRSCAQRHTQHSSIAPTEVSVSLI